MNILADKFLNLLRSQGIPAGFCFQHLTLADDESQGYCVHCFNPVMLNGKWIKVDARGNKEGVKHRFDADADICYKSALLHDISAIIKY